MDHALLIKKSKNVKILPLAPSKGGQIGNAYFQAAINNQQ
jgi:hypothetical protein